MKRNFKVITVYLLVVLLVFAYLFRGDRRVQTVENFSITQMVEKLQNGEVTKIELQSSEVKGQLKNKTNFTTFLPSELRYSFYDDYIKEHVDKGKIDLVGYPEPTTPWIYSILPTLLMLLMLGVFWFIFMQQAQGGSGKAMSFGKSKAKLHKGENQRIITFSDVAGLKEEKEELEEMVDFLRDPKKYIEIGARIPTGVLMVGPPGTGKTYLSRAVAGEARVPFFTISGSDFVEMFVGVGASRVRDLFDQAKKNAPCIIFIDEIDAVGRRRGAGLGGGHDEREQTLNQLLVEMDGFGENEGVIVMAATNRADILDPALLRPGRFDRTVYVGRPDIKGREEILEVHTKNKPLAKDVDLSIVARRTPGFTPADLENLVNEAALLTARHNLKRIPMEYIEEASIKVQAGPAKKSRVIPEKERILTAYHEAGHAIVGRVIPDSDPVHLITIIPRGMAGGFTSFIPEEDRSYMLKKEMEGELAVLLGGRVAEALVLDDISTGASNDIERATKLARAMVTSYGMSEKLGTINYGEDEHEVFVGMDYGRGRTISGEVAAEIDREMRHFIDEAYKRAEEIIKENMDALERVAKALLEKETITAVEFEKLFNGETIEDLIASEKELEEIEKKKAEIDIEEATKAYEDYEKSKLEKEERIKSKIEPEDGEENNSES